MNKNEFLHGKFSIVRTLIVAAIAGSVFSIAAIYIGYKTTMNELQERYDHPLPATRRLNDAELDKVIQEVLEEKKAEAEAEMSRCCSDSL